MQGRLTIQIVGWDSANELSAGLAALRRIPRDDVVVRYIDNASKDGSVALVRKYLADADIIELEENKGFAGAHNIGLAKCTTDFVLTHDPDVVIDWPGIQQLVRAFDNPSVGAVQGKLLRSAEFAANQKRIIDSAGIVHTLSLNGKERGANEIDQGQFAKRAQILAVTGGCGLFRMAALRDVAYNDQEFFDNDFFAYKEDIDIGWRLNNAGWRVLYLPVTAGVHKRTLGRRGVLGWGLRPDVIYKRLRSKRTRFSLRNWVWMMVKNVSWRQSLKHEIFIDLRLLFFLMLSFTYPPLLTVWWEIIKGVPKMAAKRKVARLDHARY